MKARTRRITRTLILVGSIIVIVAVLGMLTQGFQKWRFADVKETALSKVLKERNPDNLIKEIELESGKDQTSDDNF